MGNLASILNMFRRLGVAAKITGNLDEIEGAGKLLLPGVGAFDAAVEKIEEAGMTDLLNRKAHVDKIPILGICLGMQLLSHQSEEGTKRGFGWIDAVTRKFKFPPEKQMKVPHMGWSEIKVKNESPLVKGLDSQSRFYFVHSYHVVPADERNIVATSFYGYEFVSVIQSGNIFGAQFHPEKSHKYGMQLLSNFASL